MNIDFKNLVKDLKRVEFKNLKGETHSCILKGAQKQEISLPAHEFGGFLKKLFTEWAHSTAENKDVAIVEATRLSRLGSKDSRYLAMIWVLVSFVFPGLLSMSLLTDGYQNIRCSKILETGKTTTAQLQKVKKNRRGNFIWTLEFKTELGKTIRGTRVPFVYDEKGYPTQDVTVVYSDENPECWDVSMKAGVAAVNQKQRLFARWMTLGFGYCFAGLALLGMLWGLAKLRFKNPYSEELERVVKDLISSPTHI